MISNGWARITLGILATGFTMMGAISESQATYVKRVFGSWEALSGNVNGEDTCVALSHPVDTRIYEDVRDVPYLAVSYNKELTISISPGFELSNSNPVTLTVNDTPRLLKNSRDFFAHTYNSIDDVRIINDMRLDRKFCKAVSYDDEEHVAIDYYSLEGFTDAIEYLRKNCRYRSKQHVKKPD